MSNTIKQLSALLLAACLLPSTVLAAPINLSLVEQSSTVLDITSNPAGHVFGESNPAPYAWFFAVDSNYWSASAFAELAWADANGTFTTMKYINCTNCYNIYSHVALANLAPGAVMLTNGASAVIGTNGVGGGNLSVTFKDMASQVPEPASLALFGIALAGLALRKRKNA